ncbi:MAG TPA: iron-containing alcohol dehydrogenase, partial [Pyrinomonadaceae bacterium]|nr:iron-containing alcohol dehydrogenase [Pyrinomonadaceae bacterium]
GDRYGTLLKLSSVGEMNEDLSPTEALARRLEALIAAGRLEGNLNQIGVAKTDLPALAAEAAEQWTGTFNPRPFSQEGAMEVYSCAY